MTDAAHPPPPQRRLRPAPRAAATPGRVDLSGCSLLAVLAHPDDESLACGGLLAWSVAGGARVSLLCATRGEQGPGGETSAASGDGLGATRTRELEEAASVLGLADVTFLDYADGCLPWVDTAAFEGRIADTLHRLAPDVVVTFGADGLYWHPDHIALHERTTAAVAALGAEAPALYYVTLPLGCIRTLVDTISAREGARDVSRTMFGIADLDAFGALAAPPTLVARVDRFAARKLAALRCHRTQVAGSVLDIMTDRDAEDLLAVEHYRRAEVGSTGPTFIERIVRPA